MLLAVEQLMEVNMGTLDKLKFVAVAPKRKQSIAEERRQKVVQQLMEQLKLAQAAGLPPEKWSSLRYGFRAISRMKECPRRRTSWKRTSPSSGRSM